MKQGVLLLMVVLVCVIFGAIDCLRLVPICFYYMQQLIIFKQNLNVIWLEYIPLIKWFFNKTGIKEWTFFIYKFIIKVVMGGLRTNPDTKKHTICRQGYGFTYACSHMCGWRLYMEDAHIATSLSDFRNYLFAVFDGHGGPQVSCFVERNFVKELEKNNNYKKKNYEIALKQTFLKMDELLQTPIGKSQISKIQKQMSQKCNGPKYKHQSQAGCTANVCLITPQMIYVANAGDSRAVACTSKGELIELSYDHKPQNKNEFLRIKKARGKISCGRINGNLNLSRAIGDFEYKNDKSLSPEEQIVTACPEIIQIKNQGIQFIIMGCDGIWQVKSNYQMIEWIKAKIDIKDLGKIIQELFDELLSKDCKQNQFGLDNMSAILIKFVKSKK